MFFTINDIITGKKYNVNVMWITSMKNGDDSQSAPNFELLLYQGDGGRPLVESYASAAERKERRDTIVEAGSFFELNSIQYNLVWVQSVAKVNAGDPLYDGNLAQKPAVSITFANGRTIYGQFDTEQARDDFYDLLIESMLSGGLVQRDTFDDFPKKGNPGCVYLAKDTGITYYWDKVLKQYVTTGSGGRKGIYEAINDLPTTLGQVVTINKSDLRELVKPTVDFMETSDVIDDEGTRGIIIANNDTTVDVCIIPDQTIDSFKQVATEADLPETGKTNILLYVQDIDEFRIWNDSVPGWVDPFHPIRFESDITPETARTNTLYIDETEARYTSDNIEWKYITSEARPYQKGTTYYKGMLVYRDNILTKATVTFKSNATVGKNTAEAFAYDLDKGNLEVIIDAYARTNVMYDLSDQLDEDTQEFNLPAGVTPERSVLVFYAGQLLIEGVNYIIDYTNQKLRLLFEEDPDSLEDRHLTMIVGNIEAPAGVRTVTGIIPGLVDNTDPFNPVIGHDDTKIDKSIANRLVSNTDVTEVDGAVDMTFTYADTDDGSVFAKKVIFKTPNDNIEFKVNNVTPQIREIEISAFGAAEVTERAITFDGTSREFDLPINVDTTRPLVVMVNGLALTSGEDYDYVIVGNKIKFTYVFEVDSNAVIVNFK